MFSNLKSTADYPSKIIKSLDLKMPANNMTSVVTPPMVSVLHVLQSADVHGALVSSEADIRLIEISH